LSMTDRHFTLQEARALVPWLQQVFDVIKPLQTELAGAKDHVRSLMTRIQSNGGSRAEEGLEAATRVLHEAEDSIDEHAYAINERGIVLRSVEQGLVDFPSVRDGRLIHLCWLAGEPDITHWHEIDVGFAGRQPL